MAKSKYMTTIAIDTQRSAIHFYSMVGNDKSSITHNIKSYSGIKFDESFFEKFKEAVKDFVANAPSESIQKVTVVLPDSIVLTDTIKIPTVKGASQTQKMLEVTLGGLYRNRKELRIVSQTADQNKQYTTFGIAAVQSSIISSIYSACSENKLLVETLSFASASTVAGATVLYPKLKNGTYLFLDIKDIYSRFAFVVNGRVMGFYTLPFGLEFLGKTKVVREDVLFDHSYAELAVLNAREKAKAKKQLTVMAFGESSSSSSSFLDDDSDSDEVVVEQVSAEEMSTDETAADETAADENAADETTTEVLLDENGRPLKVFVRKAPKNLPKFMLRDIPETQDGVEYENFRIFVKWALTLINNNEKITEVGKPQFVCVNLPDELAHVIDKTNEEAEENGLNFIRLPYHNDAALIAQELELYGGLFPAQINSANKL